MLKAAVLFYILILSSLMGNAQNLVPNPSFEEYITCPPSVGGLAFQSPPYESLIANWYSMSVTPDYMHECAGIGASNYPLDNAWGNQSPLDGEGYIAMGMFDQFENSREYAAVELTEPMVPGQEYYVSFYASDADGGGLDNFDCSTNNIGLKFFVSPPYYWNSFDNNFSLTPTNSSDINYTEVLVDSINWTHISGIVSASQPFTHLVIGNFYDDENTEIIQTGLDGCVALYYIDYVCVAIDSSECNLTPSEIDEAFKEKLQLFPNPTSEFSEIRGFKGLSSIIIYNTSGRIVDTFYCNDPCPIDLSGLSKGLYYVRILSDDFSFQTFKLQHND